MEKTLENSRFKVDDIRPSKFDEEHAKVLLEDINMLQSRSEEFVHCNCPSCDSSQKIYRFSKRGFDYVECEACSTLFIDPRPSPDVLNWFYQESKNYAFWNKFIFPSSEDVRYKNIILPRIKKTIELCKKYKIGNESLLEIGAGFGSFCVGIKEQKFFDRVVAVEPTPDLAKTCRSKGIETIELPVEQISFSKDQLFDVVVSFEVIEHLFSPKNFLAQIFHFLKPNGILILSCPNGEGFDIEILGSASDTIDHEHLNYFNPRSITNLLNSCGFNVLEVFTPGKLDVELVRKKILNGEFTISQNPFLQRVLIDQWEQLGSVFQNFLAENSLSSNMWAIAQKSS